MSWKEELRKNWRARLSALFIILALIVLVDELVKENYAFDIYDLIGPSITHEKLFALFLLLGLLLGLRLRRS
jgi:hypothetical protein